MHNIKNRQEKQEIAKKAHILKIVGLSLVFLRKTCKNKAQKRQKGNLFTYAQIINKWVGFWLVCVQNAWYNFCYSTRKL